jgi:hypothetical protein
MIVKFSGHDLETIVRTYIDELIYGVADMKIDITVPRDSEVIVHIELKEYK